MSPQHLSASRAPLNYTPISQCDIPFSVSSPDFEAQITPIFSDRWSCIQPTPDPETIDYKFTLFGKVCQSRWFLAFYSLILYVGSKAVLENIKANMPVGVLAFALFLVFIVSRERNIESVVKPTGTDLSLVYGRYGGVSLANYQGWGVFGGTGLGCSVVASCPSCYS
jgi:hypothetical protein